MPSMADPRVTVITHARDAARHLATLLPTVAWATERIVIDMASADDTAEVARACGARVIPVPVHPRVDDIRNRHLAEAATEWILVLDADEWLAGDAQEEIARLVREHGADADAFAIPRYNRIGQRILRGSGWYPDHQIRLFRRGCVSWPGGTHRAPEVLTGPDRLHRLAPPDCLHIHHNNYADLAELIERQARYARHDVYDTSPGGFDPGAYAGAALAEYARRHEPGKDGDLSHALAIVMAWDRIMRGLIHWDHMDNPPPLDEYLVRPVSVNNRDLEGELLRAREALARSEKAYQALRNTRVIRLCRWFDRVKAGLLRRPPPA